MIRGTALFFRGGQSVYRYRPQSFIYFLGDCLRLHFDFIQRYGGTGNSSVALALARNLTKPFRIGLDSHNGTPDQQSIYAHRSRSGYV